MIMTLKLCWLIDDTEIFNSANLNDAELEDKQEEAKELTQGSMWWVQFTEEPDLPRSPAFRHLSREDIGTVSFNQRKDSIEGQIRRMRR